MPYTAKQRRYFHAQAEKGKPGMAKLASEADAYAKAGKEKPPVAASKKGMGFKAAAASVAKKEGVSKERANAIIAAGARKASPAAKKANPNLKKVKGAYKGKGK